jgi:hypothetical protein
MKIDSLKNSIDLREGSRVSPHQGDRNFLWKIGKKFNPKIVEHLEK